MIKEKNGTGTKFQYRGSLLEMNGEADHIHILFELPPQAALSNIICNLKTQASKEVRRKFGEQLASQLWGGKFWSESYFVASTGGASIDTLEKYIQEQGVVREKRKKETPE